nr:MAG TPA: hypothetical protein [Caudoviricetes sp.]
MEAKITLNGYTKASNKELNMSIVTKLKEYLRIDSETFVMFNNNREQLLFAIQADNNSEVTDYFIVKDTEPALDPATPYSRSDSKYNIISKPYITVDGYRSPVTRKLDITFYSNKRNKVEKVRADIDRFNLTGIADMQYYVPANYSKLLEKIETTGSLPITVPDETVDVKISYTARLNTKGNIEAIGPNFKVDFQIAVNYNRDSYWVATYPLVINNKVLPKNIINSKFTYKKVKPAKDILEIGEQAKTYYGSDDVNVFMIPKVDNFRVVVSKEGYFPMGSILVPIDPARPRTICNLFDLPGITINEPYKAYIIDNIANIFTPYKCLFYIELYEDKVKSSLQLSMSAGGNITVPTNLDLTKTYRVVINILTKMGKLSDPSLKLLNTLTQYKTANESGPALSKSNLATYTLTEDRSDPSKAYKLIAGKLYSYRDIRVYSNGEDIVEDGVWRDSDADWYVKYPGGADLTLKPHYNNELPSNYKEGTLPTVVANGNPAVPNPGGEDINNENTEDTRPDSDEPFVFNPAINYIKKPVVNTPQPVWLGKVTTSQYKVGKRWPLPLTEIVYEIGKDGSDTVDETGSVTPPNLDIDPLLELEGNGKIWIRVKYKSSGVHEGNNITTESEWSDKWTFQRPTLEIDPFETIVSYKGPSNSGYKIYGLTTPLLFKSPYKDKLVDLKPTEAKWKIRRKSDGHSFGEFRSDSYSRLIGFDTLLMGHIIPDNVEVEIETIITVGYKIPTIHGLKDKEKVFTQTMTYIADMLKIAKPVLSVAKDPTYGPVLRSPYNPIGGWTHPLTKIIVYVRNDELPTERVITLTGNDLLKNEIVIPHYYLADAELLKADTTIYIYAAYVSTFGTRETSSELSDILEFKVPNYAILPTDTTVENETTSEPTFKFSKVTATEGLFDYFKPVTDVSTHVKIVDRTDGTTLVDGIIPGVKDEYKAPLGTFKPGHEYRIQAKRKFIVNGYQNNATLETEIGAVVNYECPEIEYIAQPTISTPANPYYGKLTISPYQRLNNWPLTRTSVVYHYEDENDIPYGPDIVKPDSDPYTELPVYGSNMEIRVKVKYVSEGLVNGVTLKAESKWSEVYTYRTIEHEAKIFHMNIVYKEIVNDKPEYNITTSDLEYDSKGLTFITGIEEKSIEWTIYHEDDMDTPIYNKKINKNQPGYKDHRLPADLLTGGNVYIVETKYEFDLKLKDGSRIASVAAQEEEYTHILPGIEKPVLTILNNPGFGPVTKSPYTPVGGWTGNLTKVVYMYGPEGGSLDNTKEVTGADVQDPFRPPVGQSGSKIDISAYYESTVNGVTLTSPMSDRVTLEYPTYTLGAFSVSMSNTDGITPTATLTDLVISQNLKDYLRNYRIVKTFIRITDIDLGMPIHTDESATLSKVFQIPNGVLSYNKTYSVEAGYYIESPVLANKEITAGVSFTTPVEFYIDKPTLTVPNDPYYGPLTFSAYTPIFGWIEPCLEAEIQYLPGTFNPTTAIQVLKTTSDPTTLDYTLPIIASEERMNVRVRYVSKKDNKKYYSDWSEVLTYKMPKYGLDPAFRVEVENNDEEPKLIFKNKGYIGEDLPFIGTGLTSIDGIKLSIVSKETNLEVYAANLPYTDNEHMVPPGKVEKAKTYTIKASLTFKHKYLTNDVNQVREFTLDYTVPRGIIIRTPVLMGGQFTQYDEVRYSPYYDYGWEGEEDGLEIQYCTGTIDWDNGHTDIINYSTYQSIPKEPNDKVFVRARWRGRKDSDIKLSEWSDVLEYTVPTCNFEFDKTAEECLDRTNPLKPFVRMPGWKYVPVSGSGGLPKELVDFYPPNAWHVNIEKWDETENKFVYAASSMENYNVNAAYHFKLYIPNYDINKKYKITIKFNPTSRYVVNIDPLDRWCTTEYILQAGSTTGINLIYVPTNPYYGAIMKLPFTKPATWTGEIAKIKYTTSVDAEPDIETVEINHTDDYLPPYTPNNYSKEWKVVAKAISTNNEESGESTVVFRTPEIKVKEGIKGSNDNNGLSPKFIVPKLILADLDKFQTNPGELDVKSIDLTITGSDGSSRTKNFSGLSGNGPFELEIDGTLNENVKYTAKADCKWEHRFTMAAGEQTYTVNFDEYLALAIPVTIQKPTIKTEINPKGYYKVIEFNKPEVTNGTYTIKKMLIEWGVGEFGDDIINKIEHLNVDPNSIPTLEIPFKKANHKLWVRFKYSLLVPELGTDEKETEYSDMAAWTLPNAVVKDVDISITGPFVRPIIATVTPFDYTDKEFIPETIFPDRATFVVKDQWGREEYFTKELLPGETQIEVPESVLENEITYQAQILYSVTHPLFNEGIPSDATNSVEFQILKDDNVIETPTLSVPKDPYYGPLKITPYKTKNGFTGVAEKIEFKMLFSSSSILPEYLDGYYSGNFYEATPEEFKTYMVQDMKYRDMYVGAKARYLSEGKKSNWSEVLLYKTMPYGVIKHEPTLEQNADGSITVHAGKISVLNGDLPFLNCDHDFKMEELRVDVTRTSNNQSFSVNFLPYNAVKFNANNDVLIPAAQLVDGEEYRFRVIYHFFLDNENEHLLAARGSGEEVTLTHTVRKPKPIAKPTLSIPKNPYYGPIDITPPVTAPGFTETVNKVMYEYAEDFFDVNDPMQVVTNITKTGAAIADKVTLDIKKSLKKVYIRARYATDNVFSEWSDLLQIITPEFGIEKPTFTISGDGLAPTISIDPMRIIGKELPYIGEFVAESVILMIKDAETDAEVYGGEWNGTKTTIKVPDGKIQKGKKYKIQVMYGVKHAVITENNDILYKSDEVIYEAPNPKIVTPTITFYVDVNDDKMYLKGSDYATVGTTERHAYSSWYLYEKNVEEPKAKLENSSDKLLKWQIPVPLEQGKEYIAKLKYSSNNLDSELGVLEFRGLDGRPAPIKSSVKYSDAGNGWRPRYTISPYYIPGNTTATIQKFTLTLKKGTTADTKTSQPGDRIVSLEIPTWVNTRGSELSFVIPKADYITVINSLPNRNPAYPVFFSGVLEDNKGNTVEIPDIIYTYPFAFLPGKIQLQGAGTANPVLTAVGVNTQGADYFAITKTKWEVLDGATPIFNDEATGYIDNKPLGSLGMDPTKKYKAKITYTNDVGTFETPEYEFSLGEPRIVPAGFSHTLTPISDKEWTLKLNVSPFTMANPGGHTWSIEKQILKIMDGEGNVIATNESGYKTTYDISRKSTDGNGTIEDVVLEYGKTYNISLLRETNHYPLINRTVKDESIYQIDMGAKPVPYVKPAAVELSFDYRDVDDRTIKGRIVEDITVQRYFDKVPKKIIWKLWRENETKPFSTAETAGNVREITFGNGQHDVKAEDLWYKFRFKITAEWVIDETVKSLPNEGPWVAAPNSPGQPPLLDDYTPPTMRVVEKTGTTITVELNHPGSNIPAQRIEFVMTGNAINPIFRRRLKEGTLPKGMEFVNDGNSVSAVKIIVMYPEKNTENRVTFTDLFPGTTVTITGGYYWVAGRDKWGQPHGGSSTYLASVTETLPTGSGIINVTPKVSFQGFGGITKRYIDWVKIEDDLLAMGPISEFVITEGTPDGPVIGNSSYKSDGNPGNAYYAYTRVTLPKFDTTYCLTGWLNMSENVRTLKGHAYYKTEKFSAAKVEAGITSGYEPYSAVNQAGNPLSQVPAGYTYVSGGYYPCVINFTNSVAVSDDYMHEVEKFITYDPDVPTWPGETVMAEVSKKIYKFHIPYYTVKNGAGETLNWVLPHPTVKIVFKNGEFIIRKFW